VYVSLGRVSEQQGDLEQAMAAYQAALRRDNRRADAYVRLAVLHDKQGKFRESAEFYRKALQLRPGDAEIFSDMGYSLYLQRRWAEAEMNLRQAIAVNPEFPRAHNNLALLLARDNRLDEALAEFRKAGNKLAEAHLNLAFALTMDQHWGPARAEYERALALDPASAKAKARVAELNALLAKLEDPSRKRGTQDKALMTTAATVPQPRRQTASAVNVRPATDERTMNRSPGAGAPAAAKGAAVLAQAELGGRQSIPDVPPIARASAINSPADRSVQPNREARWALTGFRSLLRRLVSGRPEPQPDPVGPPDPRLFDRGSHVRPPRSDRQERPPSAPLARDTSRASPPKSPDPDKALVSTPDLSGAFWLE
jgi:Tfp pilus assembly protein PilF